MIKKRLSVLVGLLLVGSLGIAAPVLAAAPTNDTYPDRQTISTGFSDTVDTTEATTDADDVDIAAGCLGVPALDASVWYSLTATADMGIVVDVSSSTYSAGVIIASGDPGAYTVEACGPGAAVWSALSGVTYTILVFDDQEDGAGNGGTLQINVAEAPPPPELTLTVNPRGTFDSHTGGARISGTITCTGEADFSFIDVQVRQKTGRLFIDGEGFIEGFTCDGSTQAWTTDVLPFNGVFKGGRTITVTFAEACGAFECGDGFDQSIVSLSAGPGKKH
jgi:hypothetical protein